MLAGKLVVIKFGSSAALSVIGIALLIYKVTTVRSLIVMYYSVHDTGKLGKKKNRVLLSGVEPKTFRLLVRSDVLQSTGDS